MAIIVRSSKLSSDQEEQCVHSKGFVFFRIVAEGDLLKVMTATAAEDTGELRPFHDQQALLAATRSVLSERGEEWSEKEDWRGRPYVEAEFPTGADVLHIAHTVLLSLGFEDIGVLALREMKEIYSEFAIEDGEDTYLSDGMWMTPDGRIVEK